MKIQYIDASDSCTRRDLFSFDLGSREEKPAGEVRWRLVCNKGQETATHCCS